MSLTGADLSADPIAVRQRMAADRHRPLYHFLPPANWMNDPNGLIHWRGQYHLFYQYNPVEPAPRRIHWGHAVSADLVRWSDLPIALEPTPGTTDDDGCWSGCAVDANGVATLIYTGRSGERESVCLAAGDAQMHSFRKHSANPIISGPPIPDTVGFRDPYVWREGETWRMAIGSGVRGQGGRILLFESPDLVRWEHLGPLVVGAAPHHGTMWECPSFFSLGSRHVLIFSPVPTRRVFYLIGDYHDGRFIPEREGQVDWGGDFYAPQVMIDASGRRIMFGWSWEARQGTLDRPANLSSQQEAGWAGVQTLPRLLSISADGELAFDPAPEVTSLRVSEQELGPRTLAPRSENALPLAGDRLELALTLAPGARHCALQVRSAADGSEATVIRYDPAAQTLSIDRTHASLSPETIRDVREAPLILGDDEPLSLRIFLDASIIEVYANRRRCLTTRIYPSKPDSVGIRLVAGEAPVLVEELRAWKMEAIWPAQES